MKKLLERLAILVLVLVVLLVAVLFIAGNVTEQRRDAAVAKFRERIPAGHIQGQTSDSGPDHRDPSADKSSTSKEPSAEERAEAFARLLDAYEEIGESKSWEICATLQGEKPPAEWSAEEWKTARDFVSANTDFLAWIRREAGKGGPIRLLEEAPEYELDLGHLAQVRDLARMLALEAAVSVHDGQASTATADVAAMMQLGLALTEEPTTISHLVNMAVASMAFGAVCDAIPADTLNADQTQALVAQATTGARHSILTDKLAAEGLMTLAYFDRLRSGDDWLSRLLGSPLGAPWVYMDEAAYSDAMGRLVEAAALPYHEAVPLIEALSWDVDALPRTRLITRVSVPTVSRLPAAHATYETQLDLMRIGLLGERYDADHGTPPASLDVLTSDLGGTVPQDPFTNQAYHYTVQDGSFQLYSVGPNGIDDGGHSDFRNGDIVWRGDN